MPSYIVRAMTRDGSARIVFADTTDIVAKAHEIHSLSKTITATLGRALTAASMMGSLLKDKNDTLSIQIRGDGPAGMVVCISDYSGNVRGYVQNPEIELPPNSKGKLDVGGSIGNGTLTVVRKLEDSKEPYIGVSNLVSGEIAEDITEYFATSEQTPTACALGVLTNKDTTPRASGGFLLQLLPYADDSILPILEKNLADLPPVSSLLSDGLSGEEIISRVLSGIDFDIFDSYEIEYRCPCTRETYIKGLMSLGRDELTRLIEEEDPVQTRCMYCGAVHSFGRDDILGMIEALKKKGEEKDGDA